MALVLEKLNLGASAEVAGVALFKGVEDAVAKAQDKSLWDRESKAPSTPEDRFHVDFLFERVKRLFTAVRDAKGSRSPASIHSRWNRTSIKVKWCVTLCGWAFGLTLALLP